MPQNDRHSFSHGPQVTKTIQNNRRANGGNDESKNRSMLMPLRIINSSPKVMTYTTCVDVVIEKNMPCRSLTTRRHALVRTFTSS